MGWSLAAVGGSSYSGNCLKTDLLFAAIKPFGGVDRPRGLLFSQHVASFGSRLRSSGPVPVGYDDELKDEDTAQTRGTPRSSALLPKGNLPDEVDRTGFLQHRVERLRGDPPVAIETSS